MELSRSHRRMLETKALLRNYLRTCYPPPPIAIACGVLSHSERLKKFKRSSIKDVQRLQFEDEAIAQGSYDIIDMFHSDYAPAQYINRVALIKALDAMASTALFTIPPELRLIIYDCLLPQGMWIVNNYYSKPVVRSLRQMEGGFPETRYFDPRVIPTLLKINQQIRSKAAEVFFATSTSCSRTMADHAVSV